MTTVAVQALNNVAIQFGGTGGSAAWVDFPGTQSFGEPSIQSDKLDATDFDSTDGFEELLAGILRTGEVAVSFHYAPANSAHEAIRAAANGRAKAWFRVLLGNTVDSTTKVTSGTAVKIVTWRGYVTWTPTYEHAGKIMGSISIKPTGAITVTTP
jgi:hypothetical protein